MPHPVNLSHKRLCHAKNETVFAAPLPLGVFCRRVGVKKKLSPFDFKCAFNFSTEQFQKSFPFIDTFILSIYLTILFHTNGYDRLDMLWQPAAFLRNFLFGGGLFDYFLKSCSSENSGNLCTLSNSEKRQE